MERIIHRFRPTVADYKRPVTLAGAQCSLFFTRTTDTTALVLVGAHCRRVRLSEKATRSVASNHVHGCLSLSCSVSPGGQVPTEKGPFPPPGPSPGPRRFAASLYSGTPPTYQITAFSQEYYSQGSCTDKPLVTISRDERH
ncbi:hypothetical protein SKAU_G00047850 [Synaphobranchus kaupii]|uniref:Uncharacterized protein n=1 Tax=Synaphobranchus kaupii TaxID=118154 RepID=A0A9Q1J9G2_SYNKA|nr:hypothetical protein SKAU_G00047850 [Synaphobranchus kaupii]